NDKALDVIAGNLHDPSRRGDKKLFIISPDQIAGHPRVQIEETRSAWAPTPQPGLCKCPYVPTVLVQGCYPPAQAAILPIAARLTLLDRAEFSAGRRLSAGPNRSFTILRKGEHILASDFGIETQPAIFPTRQSGKRPDPEPSVARNQQLGDVGV